MKVYQKFRSVVYGVAKFTNFISVILICVMTVLMCLDIFGRNLFNRAITGTYELVENIMLTIMALAFAQTQAIKKNINVDIVVNKLPRKAKDILNIITTLMALAFFIFCAYSNLVQSAFVMGKKITTNALLIPLWPFNGVMGIGICILSLVLVCDVIDSFIDFFNVHVNAKDAQSE